MFPHWDRVMIPNHDGGPLVQDARWLRRFELHASPQKAPLRDVLLAPVEPQFAAMVTFGRTNLHGGPTKRILWPGAKHLRYPVLGRILGSHLDQRVHQRLSNRPRPPSSVRSSISLIFVIPLPLFPYRSAPEAALRTACTYCLAYSALSCRASPRPSFVSPAFPDPPLVYLIQCHPRAATAPNRLDFFSHLALLLPCSQHQHPTSHLFTSFIRICADDTQGLLGSWSPRLLQFCHHIFPSPAWE